MAERRDERVGVMNINTQKRDKSIDKRKYDVVRKAIFAVVPNSGDGLLFSDLRRVVKRELPGGELPGGGSVSWYVTTVKLDLEYRGLIHRVPGSRPQRLLRGRAPKTRRAE